MKWIHYPFLRILPLFISGILIGNVIHITIFSCYFLMLLIVISLLFCILLYIGVRKYFYRIGFKFFLIGLFLWIGILCAQVNIYLQKPNLSSVVFNESEYYTAMVASNPDFTEKFIKYEAVVKSLYVKGEWISADKKAVLYFDKETVNALTYGDVILINSQLQFVENNKNPHAFDYGLYLQRRGIFLQDFIFEPKFTVLNPGHKTSVRFWGLAAGNYLEKILTKYIHSPREANIVKAMLLGRRNEINPEMKGVYQSTGTAHILAVSGLHVGIVYLLVSSAFKFLKGKKPKWLFYVIVLFCIWSFAFITGFSPSVQRAAVMFSFILMGKVVRRKGNTYNTVLASAFFILLFAPNLIYSVSFQLSYAAVLGIVFLYPKIYPLVYFKNRILDFFWQITVLSLSVQLIVFPITIYYFNQFPVLFAFTNLIAIPTATAVIVGSIGILLTSFLGIIPTVIGMVLEYWIRIYNNALVQISELPFSEIQNLNLKSYIVFLIIIEVILLTQFLNSGKLTYFRYFTFGLILFVFSSFIDRYRTADQQMLTFYQIDDSFIYDIFLGHYCFTNIKPEESHDQVFYNVLPNRKYHSIESVSDISKLDNFKKLGKNSLIYLNNRIVFILKDLNDISRSNAPIEVDDLVIDRKMISRLSEISDNLCFQNLILADAAYREDQLRIPDSLNSIHIHSLHYNGAYIIQL